MRLAIRKRRLRIAGITKTDADAEEASVRTRKGDIGTSALVAVVVGGAQKRIGGPLGSERRPARRKERGRLSGRRSSMPPTNTNHAADPRQRQCDDAENRRDSDASCVCSKRPALDERLAHAIRIIAAAFRAWRCSARDLVSNT